MQCNVEDVYAGVAGGGPTEHGADAGEQGRDQVDGDGRAGEEGAHHLLRPRHHGALPHHLRQGLCNNNSRFLEMMHKFCPKGVDNTHMGCIALEVHNLKKWYLLCNFDDLLRAS